MKQLKPYQLEDALTISKRKAALVPHEPRVGKSPIAIKAADLLPARVVVVICPANVKENWRVAVEEFRVGDWVAFFVSYNKAGEFAMRWRHYVKGNKHAKINVLIVDESHYAKDKSAQRTRWVYGSQCDGVGGLVEMAEHVYCLTGTPMPNHPLELWPMLRALAPHLIVNDRGKPMTASQFGDKFCKKILTPFGSKIVGSKNSKDLKVILDEFSVRKRTRLEVFGRDIQPPTRFYVAPANEFRTKLRDLEGSEQGRRVLKALENGGIKALAREEKHVASVRRLIGLAKVPGVANMIAGELDDEPRSKQVIFAYHREVIEMIVQALKKYGAQPYYGGLTPDRKVRLERGFKTESKFRVIVGQITAAGVGLDFSASDVATFAEQDWVGDNNEQARSRIFNMNSPNPKFTRFAVLRGSIDENIVAASERKMNDSKKIFG